MNTWVHGREAAVKPGRNQGTKVAGTVSLDDRRGGDRNDPPAAERCAAGLTIARSLRAIP